MQWSTYCAVIGVLGLMIALSQVDSLSIHLGADLLFNTYINVKVMQTKLYYPSNKVQVLKVGVHTV